MPTPSSAAIGIESADVPLARAVLYGALSTVFRRPSPGIIESLGSPVGSRTLSLAACVLSGNSDSDLSRAARRLPGCVTQEGALAGAYDRLFGHTPRGRVCPYEMEYGADELFRQAHELAEIAGYYRAFGLQPRPGVGERIDHIGCECEFVSFLCCKEAFLIDLLAASADVDAAQADTLEATQLAQRSFLRRHLARFGIAFATRLTAEDPDGPYGAAGDLLRHVLAADCARCQVPVGPAVLELRSAFADQVPMACGTGDELIQIQGLTRT